MNRFELQIWDDECRRCSFYTVLKDGAQYSETDKFFLRFEDEENEFHEESNIILRLIQRSIGEKYGAVIDFFDRHKNLAQSLPPKPKRSIRDIEEIGIHFPLRLYCLRISEKLVILFNGGIKTSRTDQESSDLNLKFNEAQVFAKRIFEAIDSGVLVITSNGRHIEDFNGLDEIIL